MREFEEFVLCTRKSLRVPKKTYDYSWGQLFPFLLDVRSPGFGDEVIRIPENLLSPSLPTPQPRLTSYQ